MDTTMAIGMAVNPASPGPVGLSSQSWQSAENNFEKQCYKSKSIVCMFL